MLGRASDCRASAAQSPRVFCTRWAAAFCFALAAASVGSHALAEPTAAEKETARALFNEAADLRDAGKLRDSLAKFKTAHALGRTPITGLELGRTHKMLGELIEAREAFLSVARIRRKPTESAASSDARATAATLAQELRPRIPSVMIKVTEIPEGQQATVLLDGTAIKDAALVAPIKVNPGTHVLILKVVGHEERRQEVSVAEGVTVNVDLAPGAATSAPQPEAATSGPQPDAAASSAASTPTHTTSASSAKPSRTLTWLGFGVGGAGLVFGSVTGVMALSKTNSTRDACPDNVCPPSQHDNLGSAKSLAWMSTAGFAVAGAGAAIGVFTLVSGRSTTEQAARAVTVTPVLGWGTGGVTGTF